MTDTALACRHFTSYSGVSLPLKLVGELDEAELGNRNTFFRGFYNEDEVLMRCEKVVYGEIEMTHVYEYEEGRLRKATIIPCDEDEEAEIIEFD